MTSTKTKLEFVHAMARSTRATVRQCEALMRFACTYKGLSTDTRKLHIANRVMKLCQEIDTGVDEHKNGSWQKARPLPIFDGAALRIRIPEGREIEVPA